MAARDREPFDVDAQLRAETERLLAEMDSLMRHAAELLGDHKRQVKTLVERRGEIRDRRRRREAAASPAAPLEIPEEFASCFSRSADESWTCTSAATLFSPRGRLEITEGSRFYPGTTFMGFDFAKWLDQRAAPARST